MSTHKSSTAILEMIQKLDSFDKLRLRLDDEQIKAKRAAARLFANYWFRHALGSRRLANVFIESGTALYFVMEAIAGMLRDSSDMGKPCVNLTTNNFFAFMLGMIEHFPCSLLPWGAPDDKYAAFYGDLERVIGPSEPDYSLAELHDTDRDAINTMLDQLLPKITGWQGPSLILGATSGLQMGTEMTLSPDLKPKQRADYYRDLLVNMRGPHTGGHKNKLFKRFLYETGLPQVIFAHASKIDCEIKVDACCFVYDNAEAWERALETQPLAFCIGRKQSEFERVRAPFENVGMSIMPAPVANDGITAFLARTSRFEDFEREAFRHRIGESMIERDP